MQAMLPRRRGDATLALHLLTICFASLAYLRRLANEALCAEEPDAYHGHLIHVLKNLMDDYPCPGHHLRTKENLLRVFKYLLTHPRQVFLSYVYFATRCVEELCDGWLVLGSIIFILGYLCSASFRRHPLPRRFLMEGPFFAHHLLPLLALLVPSQHGLSAVLSHQVHARPVYFLYLILLGASFQSALVAFPVGVGCTLATTALLLWRRVPLRYRPVQVIVHYLLAGPLGLAWAAVRDGLLPAGALSGPLRGVLGQRTAAQMKRSSQCADPGTCEKHERTWSKGGGGGAPRACGFAGGCSGSGSGTSSGCGVGGSTCGGQQPALRARFLLPPFAEELGTKAEQRRRQGVREEVAGAERPEQVCDLGWQAGAEHLRLPHPVSLVDTAPTRRAPAVAKALPAGPTHAGVLPLAPASAKVVAPAAAAADAAPPPPPAPLTLHPRRRFAAAARPCVLRVRIVGAEPEQLPPDWRQQVYAHFNGPTVVAAGGGCAVVAAAGGCAVSSGCLDGYMLTGVAVRRGSIYLTLSLMPLPGGGQANGGAEAEAEADAGAQAGPAAPHDDRAALENPRADPGAEGADGHAAAAQDVDLAAAPGPELVPALAPAAAGVGMGNGNDVAPAAAAAQPRLYHSPRRRAPLVLRAALRTAGMSPAAGQGPAGGGRADSNPDSYASSSGSGLGPLPDMAVRRRCGSVDSGCYGAATALPAAGAAGSCGVSARSGSGFGSTNPSASGAGSASGAPPTSARLVDDYPSGSCAMPTPPQPVWHQPLPQQQPQQQHPSQHGAGRRRLAGVMHAAADPQNAAYAPCYMRSASMASESETSGQGLYCLVPAASATLSSGPLPTLHAAAVAAAAAAAGGSTGNSGGGGYMPLRYMASAAAAAPRYHAGAGGAASTPGRSGVVSAAAPSSTASVSATAAAMQVAQLLEAMQLRSASGGLHSGANASASSNASPGRVFGAGSREASPWHARGGAAFPMQGAVLTAVGGMDPSVALQALGGGTWEAVVSGGAGPSSSWEAEVVYAYERPPPPPAAAAAERQVLPRHQFGAGPSRSNDLPGRVGGGVGVGGGGGGGPVRGLSGLVRGGAGGGAAAAGVGPAPLSDLVPLAAGTASLQVSNVDVRPALLCKARLAGAAAAAAAASDGLAASIAAAPAAGATAAAAAAPPLAELRLSLLCPPAAASQLSVMLRYCGPSSVFGEQSYIPVQLQLDPASPAVAAAVELQAAAAAAAAGAGGDTQAARDVAGGDAGGLPAALAATAAAPLLLRAKVLAALSELACPGVLYVELWQGPQLCACLPVLLLPEASAGWAHEVCALWQRQAEEGEAAAAVAAGGGGGDGGALLAAAAHQVVEDLGGWLTYAAHRRLVMERAAATAAGVHDAASIPAVTVATAAPSPPQAGGSSRGTLAADGGGGGGPAVLMQAPPASADDVRSESLWGEGTSAESLPVRPSPPPLPDSVAAAGGGGGGAAAMQYNRELFHDMMLQEGYNWLADCVEAGCVGLAAALLGSLLGAGVTLPEVLRTCRSADGLPLGHAAALSGSPAMEALVQGWAALAAAVAAALAGLAVPAAPVAVARLGGGEAAAVGGGGSGSGGRVSTLGQWMDAAAIVETAQLPAGPGGAAGEAPAPAPVRHSSGGGGGEAPSTQDLDLAVGAGGVVGSSYMAPTADSSKDRSGASMAASAGGSTPLAGTRGAAPAGALWRERAREAGRGLLSRAASARVLAAVLAVLLRMAARVTAAAVAAVREACARAHASMALLPCLLARATTRLLLTLPSPRATVEAARRAAAAALRAGDGWLLSLHRSLLRCSVALLSPAAAPGEERFLSFFQLRHGWALSARSWAMLPLLLLAFGRDAAAGRWAALALTPLCAWPHALCAAADVAGASSALRRRGEALAAAMQLSLAVAKALAAVGLPAYPGLQQPRRLFWLDVATALLVLCEPVRVLVSLPVRLLGFVVSALLYLCAGTAATAAEALLLSASCQCFGLLLQHALESHYRRAFAAVDAGGDAAGAGAVVQEPGTGLSDGKAAATSAAALDAGACRTGKDDGLRGAVAGSGDGACASAPRRSLSAEGSSAGDPSTSDPALERRWRSVFVEAAPCGEAAIDPTSLTLLDLAAVRRCELAMVSSEGPATTESMGLESGGAAALQTSGVARALQLHSAHGSQLAEWSLGLSPVAGAGARRAAAAAAAAAPVCLAVEGQSNQYGRAVADIPADTVPVAAYAAGPSRPEVMYAPAALPPNAHAEAASAELPHQHGDAAAAARSCPDRLPRVWVPGEEQREQLQQQGRELQAEREPAAQAGREPVVQQERAQREGRHAGQVTIASDGEVRWALREPLPPLWPQGPQRPQGEQQQRQGTQQAQGQVQRAGESQQGREARKATGAPTSVAGALRVHGVASAACVLAPRPYGSIVESAPAGSGGNALPLALPPLLALSNTGPEPLESGAVVRCVGDTRASPSGESRCGPGGSSCSVAGSSGPNSSRVGSSAASPQAAFAEVRCSAGSCGGAGGSVGGAGGPGSVRGGGKPATPPARGGVSAGCIPGCSARGRGGGSSGSIGNSDGVSSGDNGGERKSGSRRWLSRTVALLGSALRRRRSARGRRAGEGKGDGAESP